MSVRRLTRSLAGLCVALVPTLLSAQAPAERHALAAFADTLDAVSDTTALRRREAALREPAGQRDGALAAMRLGFPLFVAPGSSEPRRHFPLGKMCS